MSESTNSPGNSSSERPDRDELIKASRRSAARIAFITDQERANEASAAVEGAVAAVTKAMAEIRRKCPRATARQLVAMLAVKFYLWEARPKCRRRPKHWPSEMALPHDAPGVFREKPSSAEDGKAFLRVIERVIGRRSLAKMGIVHRRPRP